MSVNGLHFTASHVKGQRLKDANFLGLVAVRAYYALKQSDGLVRCIELTLESEDEMNDDLKGAMARAEAAAKPRPRSRTRRNAAHARIQAQNAVDATQDAAPFEITGTSMDAVDRDGAPTVSEAEAATRSFSNGVPSMSTSRRWRGALPAVARTRATEPSLTLTKTG